MISTSISRLSLVGMVVVSWISIVLIGGAWVGRMVYDFSEESDQLRASHYASQKNLVQSEVQKAVAVVNSIRAEGLEATWAGIRNTGYRAQVIASHLSKDITPAMSPENIMQSVADTMAPMRPDGVGAYQVLGDTAYLIKSLPEGVDHDHVLRLLAETLDGMTGGERQVVINSADGLEHYTMLLHVTTLKWISRRIVSGTCLEMAEEEIKQEAVKRLETVRFGEDGYLFGGTWQGISVIGPAKGKNMWEVADNAGVKVVQRLVAASRNGGGFVSYVMPRIEGRRHTNKVSYSEPIHDWEWYVGAGLYVDDIEALIDQNRTALEQDILHRAGVTSLFLIGLSVIVLWISHRFSTIIRNNLHEFTEVWNRATFEGDQVDLDRLQFNEFKELAKAANRMVEARRAAEAAANENALSFRTLVANIPGVVYRRGVGPDAQTHFISSSVKEVTGYAPEEFMDRGRSLDSLIVPDDSDWVSKAIAQDVESGSAFSFEYRIRRADGQNRWVMEQGQAQYDEEGAPTMLDGVIVDISSKREAEEEHFSHLHFLRTMEQLDHCIRRHDDVDEMLHAAMELVRKSFGADRSWLLHPCDPSVEEFTVPVERFDPEYPGAGAQGVNVPVDAETAEVFSLALEHRGPVAYDVESAHQVPRSTREHFNVQAQMIVALYPRIGEPWLLGLHQCRNERVWSSDEKELLKEVSRRIADALSNLLIFKELKDSEEKFRTFSEQTMLGICVVQDNLVKFVNQAYCDIFEVSIEEMTALPPGGFIRFVHPDDQAFLLDQAAKKQAGEEDVVATYSWRAITATGRVRWVEIHSKTVSLDGRAAILVSLRDITDARQFNDKLESQVAERTSELAAANDRLIMLDELKSSFLTTVSHDLRTPLTSVLGYSRLIRRDLEKLLADPGGSGAEEIRERLVSNTGVVEDESRRLGLLINDFMDLTAIKADTGVWNDMQVEPAVPLQHAANRCAPLAASKTEVDFVLDLPEQLTPLRIDPDRLEQVAYALMNNGLRFTSQGHVTVRAESGSDGSLTLTVQDTGKGIAQSNQEAIFDAFHQVEMSDTLVDDVKGSGLGLTLSRGIVEHYGGTIEVESVPNEGATFTVHLPRDGASE